jgi:hypothetical protein
MRITRHLDFFLSIKTSEPVEISASITKRFYTDWTHNGHGVTVAKDNRNGLCPFKGPILWGLNRGTAFQRPTLASTELIQGARPVG